MNSTQLQRTTLSMKCQIYRHSQKFSKFVPCCMIPFHAFCHQSTLLNEDMSPSHSLRMIPSFLLSKRDTNPQNSTGIQGPLAAIVSIVTSRVTEKALCEEPPALIGHARVEINDQASRRSEQDRSVVLHSLRRRLSRQSDLQRHSRILG